MAVDTKLGFSMSNLGSRMDIGGDQDSTNQWHYREDKRMWVSGDGKRVDWG